MVEIRFKMPDLLGRLKRGEKRIVLGMLAAMQENRAQVFDSEGSFNGAPKWKPLKCRDGMILSDTGALRRSIAPSSPTGLPGPGGAAFATGDLKKKEFYLASKLPYAAMMNWGTTGLSGGVLRAKPGKSLVFDCGGSKVFAQQVKIPARRFDRFTAEDKRELTLTLRNLLVEVLGGKRKA